MDSKKILFFIYIVLLNILFLDQIYSQTGISVSPPRVYYQLNPGEAGSQKILISNISKSNALNLSLTFGDWKYDDWGNNLMLPSDSLSNSCASWLSVSGGTYITLDPGENKEIELTMNVPLQPKEKENTQTAMFYVTQMNPVDGVDAKGAAIKINVRSGIKIYRKGSAPEIKKLEIEKLSFDKEKNSLALVFNNKGNIWINGNVKTSLFNQTIGKETNLKSIEFYTLPDDHRTMYIPLNQKLDKGQYIATVMLDYGDDNNIEAAELEFGYE
ncbi:molecular chaperone [Parabacteroides sp. Marseille-P3160]|uniref:fimbrial biogenesis chaperone n=1 Tax=Parabacteroides sp. Marseille-P3160 TaxID=1917887 RepID=UPI0009B9549B|nr:molecular chaperone [Parabacteroides sp. Marseille-P3160]